MWEEDVIAARCVVRDVSEEAHSAGRVRMWEEDVIAARCVVRDVSEVF
jgi:hypothetical protein